MVVGLIPTLAIGVVGGAASELIRIGGMLRENKRPQGLEILGSVIFALLGAGILIYGWNSPRTAFEVATIGAAFPQLFQAGIRAATKPSGDKGGVGAATDQDAEKHEGVPLPPAPRQRSLVDYWAGRF